MQRSNLRTESLKNSAETAALIFMHGSNHPRRVSAIKCANVSLSSSYRLKKNQPSPKKYRWLTHIYFFVWMPVPILLRIWSLLSRKSWYSLAINAKNKRVLLFVGDSHSEFASRVNIKSSKIKLFTLWLGPLLCNSFSRNPEIHSGILECARNLLALNASSINDLAIVYFMGEIDIRAHSWIQIVLKKNYSSIDHYAANLAAAYVKRIEEGILEASCFGISRVCAIVMQPVPPSDNKTWIEPKAMADYKEHLRNHEYPRIGSPCFRREVHASFSYFLMDKIAASTVSDKIKYCQLPLEVFDVHGGLCRRMSKDGCHIDNPRAISLTAGLIWQELDNMV